ncbi:hypothetical protein L7F22_016933 [Adiantum nelumboides]|nr:hypothetical protein [Adiantum nelumboides]
MSTSKDRDIYDIIKLDGTNFQLWKNQMQDVLVQKKQKLPIIYATGMQKEKALSTPLPAYLKLSKNNCLKSVEEKIEMAKIPYASACGSFMYAMVAKRLDIAHAVEVVSRFMSNYGKKHWDAVKSILRYLNGTIDR